MFKFLRYSIVIIAIFLFARDINASEKINLYFFYGDGCPHCAKEEVFFEKLEKEEENIEIFYYETWKNRENAELLKKVAKKLGVEVGGVPFLVIGDKTVVGFYSEETTGEKIRRIINDYKEEECSDVVEPIINQDDENICATSCDGNHECIDSCKESDECTHNCGCSADVTKEQGEEKYLVTVPLLGEIDARKFSLPILTVVIAAIDGFNPCAMWILLFLISLLLGMQDKKRMWILGGAFIMSSAFVYFLFLTAWLKMFMFLGFVQWVRTIIAIVAIVGGVYHLKEYFTKKDVGCEVTNNEKRKAIFDKLKEVATEKKFWLALLGIIVLAFAVNLVELVCSAGLPAMYTQVLSLSDLPAWKHYGYLLLYILVFMLDDLFVFFVAMSTLQMKAISSKYTRVSGLIGGVVMIIIGFLLYFKPGWLMFG